MTSISTVQTVYETEYATLWYYPEHKIVRHQFHKYMHGQQFRGLLEKGLEVLKEHKADKWLSDDRKNSALSTEDFEWSLVDWFPRAAQAGWRYWAIIMPDKIVGQKNMNRLIRDDIENAVTIQVFEDPDEALRWLESV